MPAVEIQQGWSRGVDVNLLAANAGLGYAHSGSGIYHRGRVLAAHYDPTAALDDRLLVARVPKLLHRSNKVNKIRAGSALSAPPLPAASVQAFDVNIGTSQSISASSGTFTCRATVHSVNQTVPGTDRYMVMAVNGAWFGGVLPSRSCALLRCGSLSESDCAERASCWTFRSKDCPGGRGLWDSAADLSATTIFSSVELEGNFETADVVLPMVGTSMGQLIDANAITLDFGRMRATLDRPLLNAMLFAIPEEHKEAEPHEVFV
eukprot:gnl/TRDRNA2_/TRDRNA2_146555_c0_seq1.p1 gnl/TRDRNA2_/TRDRNA2_146555_c0~~gnl/TRDRNA2_/TRDRNA2_146555_c0_seq1.p1  ORF type:complete len:292 (-),score=45.37 gnl/TRDRNA2_/TRDRNA2_146555_c0_seq1:58-846(-)